MHSVVATLQEPEESCLKSPDPFCLNGIVWNTTVLLSCYSLPIYMCQAVIYTLGCVLCVAISKCEEHWHRTIACSPNGFLTLL